MDIRIKDKCPKIGRYKFPYYIHVIGHMINNGIIHLRKNRDGNGYVSINKFHNGIVSELYLELEQVLLLPTDSITEININMDEHKLDIYTFHTVSSRGLSNLQREYRVGYGLEACIGIHIDLKPELSVLMQLQNCVDKHGVLLDEAGDQRR